MADADTLTLAYVSGHPADAARVLEALAPVEAAAVVSGLPARVAAPALTAMLPPAAARVITALSDSVALSVLSAAGAQAAVAILRHVPEPRRTRLVEGLPTATALAARLLLGYPEDSAGAWSDPQAITLGPRLPAGEALARVRGELGGGTESVYVVGEEQRLMGVIDLATLVRAPDWRRLEVLMRPPPGTLSAVTPLAAAADHPAWEHVSELPVVARGDRLVGVLRHSVLRGALAGSEGAHVDEENELSLAGFAAGGYWAAVSGLVRAFVSLLPRAASVTRKAP
jgi:Mg/Co/Ni transporter MgtE